MCPLLMIWVRGRIIVHDCSVTFPYGWRTVCHCRHITGKGTSVNDKLARAQTQGPALLEGARVINSYSVRLLFLHKPQWLFTRVEAFDEIVTAMSLHLSWMDAPWNDRALFYWSETLPMFITMALGLSLSSHSGSYSPCSPCGCPMCIQTGCWWENRVHEPLWRP